MTQVCLEVGFASLGSFSSLFARRIGASPAAYRRRDRALVDVPGTLPASLIPGCYSLMWGWPATMSVSNGSNSNYREATYSGSCHSRTP